MIRTIITYTLYTGHRREKPENPLKFSGELFLSYPKYLRPFFLFFSLSLFPLNQWWKFSCFSVEHRTVTCVINLGNNYYGVRLFILRSILHPCGICRLKFLSVWKLNFSMESPTNTVPLCNHSSLYWAYNYKFQTHVLHLTRQSPPNAVVLAVRKFW